MVDIEEVIEHILEAKRTICMGYDTIIITIMMIMINCFGSSSLERQIDRFPEFLLCIS